MARLNWQNVAAPSFAGVSDSYRVMSDLLGRATESGSAMIDTFTKARSDAADRIIMERMLGVQDPSQFNAQQIIGAQGGRASMDMLENVDRYQDTLINRDIRKDTHSQNERDWAWTNTGREQLSTNSDQISAALRAATLNNNLEPLFNLPLRADLLSTYLNQGSASSGSKIGRDVSLQNLEERDYDFDRQRDNDKFADSAAGDAEALYQMGFGMGDPTLDEQIINQTGWDDRRKARARAAIARGGAPVPGGGGGGFTGGPASTGGGNSGGSGSGSSNFTYDAPQQAVASVLKSGGMNDAGVAAMLGNFHVEGGYGGALGDGGSASGIAQWRGPRREAFRDKYGRDPHEATPQQQAEFALWELTTPEGRAVSGISEENANRILNATDPAEAARLVDQYYERSNGQHRDRRVAAANDAYTRLTGAGVDSLDGSQAQQQDPGTVNPTGVPDWLLPIAPTPSRFADASANALFDVARADTQANASSLNRSLAALEGVPDQDINTLSKGLIEQAGYDGYSTGEMNDLIRELSAKHKISNNQAALILSQMATDRNIFIEGADRGLNSLNKVPILNWIIPDSTISTNTYDQDQIDQAARDYTEGGDDTFDMNQQRARLAQGLQLARQEVEQNVARVQQFQQRYDATRSAAVLSQLKSAQARLQAAQAAEAMLIREQGAFQPATTSDLSLPSRMAAEQAELARRRAQGNASAGPSMDQRVIDMRLFNP